MLRRYKFALLDKVESFKYQYIYPIIDQILFKRNLQQASE